MAAGRPPAVLFADDGTWDCFFHLAARLRRAGIRTLRLTTEELRRAETALGLVFDHSVRYQTDADLAGLRAIVERYTIVDVQPTETVAELAYSFVDGLGAPHHLHRWAMRPAMIDKPTISAALGSGGLCVPETLLAADVEPRVAVERLGLPIVMKERIGTGGTGVSIVDTLADLEVRSAVAARESDIDVFYERYVAGDAFSYGGLATEQGIVLGATYAVCGRATPLSPPTAVESVDSPEIDEVGAAVVATTGLLGLLNLNLIRDAAGVYWVHDVNPRAWGTLPTCSALGADFGTAYVRWLQGAPNAVSHSDPGVGPVFIFPGALRVLPRSGGERRAFFRWLLAQRKLCGIGFILVEIARNRHLLSSHPDI
jgi:hypothetical protein